MSVRRSALLAVAALGFATLAACGSSSSPSGSGSSPGSAASSPAKLKSIFFANPLPAYPDWATADKCFTSETAKLGIKGVTQGPTGLQINDQFVLDRISQAIAQNYGALMAVPITPSAYEPLFQRAKSKGMEIATLNTGTATKTQNLEVGTDYGTQGAKVAANIGMRPGQQNVGVIINAFKSHLPPNV